MKIRFGRCDRPLFGAGHLEMNQILNIRQPVFRIQRDEICLYRACPHQLDSRQQNAVDIKQRLHPRRILLYKQAPLRFREPEVMVAVASREAAPRDFLKFLVPRVRLHDQR